jgi:CBS domain-containing protein
METAEIGYRVADFLKQHAPFQGVDDSDLLELAARGRVRFHEANEYLLWQGEPHKAFVFVIQQGTVSLWDESGARAELRDVRGTGDMLGIERYNDARSCLYSARSESEVVIYAFPADDFEACVLKYPHAAQYVAAEGHATPDYRPVGGPRDPQDVFLHDLVARRRLPVCGADGSLADAARSLLASRSHAIAAVDADDRLRSVLTAERLIGWVAAGGGDARRPIEDLLPEAPVVVAPDATVAQGVLTMGAAGADVLAVTADGTATGALQALVTSADLAALFGEQPASLLREIRRAGTVQELGELNRRSRAFALHWLTGAASVEWLAQFTHLVDAAIVNRLLGVAGGEPAPGSWCFCGSAGRGESLTRLAPQLLVVLEDHDAQEPVREAHRRVVDLLGACDYLPRPDPPFEPAFYVAAVSEWRARYRHWIADPVRQQTYRARSLFDLRHVLGSRPPWQAIEAGVADGLDRDFVRVLANDCLASLPPLTFFQDTVVDSVGEQHATFRLEHSALRPLVDVGRVFGLAAGAALGRSTLERFARARARLPEYEALFREASDALRTGLWLQGRVGIDQGTRGADLPPSLLSRHDRQILKGGFRSILRLLEFTADLEWLERL